MNLEFYINFVNEGKKLSVYIIIYIYLFVQFWKSAI